MTVQCATASGTARKPDGLQRVGDADVVASVANRACNRLWSQVHARHPRCARRVGQAKHGVPRQGTSTGHVARRWRQSRQSAPACRGRGPADHNRPAAWHARARARPAGASESPALGSRVEVSVGSSIDSCCATASWQSRAERRATHGTGAHGGQEALSAWDRSGEADPVPSRTARSAGTCRYLEIGPRASLPSPAATARRQAGAGGPGQRDAHEQRIVGDPDVRPTGTSRQYCPMNSGALLAGTGQAAATAVKTYRRWVP